MKTRRVLVVQHAEPEHLGRIANALTTEGVDFETVRADLSEPIPPNLNGFSGLILMGGPQGVYETDRFPFLKQEKVLTQQAINDEFPVLGVCLGSQILAEVLGAKVRPSGSFEVGWKEVTLNRECASDPVLRHLPNPLMPLHWHGDVYDLPPGAKAIGFSSMTPVQGFFLNERFYGLLFHLEITLTQLTAMVECFPDDLQRGGVTADTVMDSADDRLAALYEPGLRMFRQWSLLV